MSDAPEKQLPLSSRIRRGLVISSKGVGVIIILAAFALIDASLIEPRWLQVRHVTLSESPTHDFVLIADIHHKGAKAFLYKIVEKINAIEPDFVCIAGDFVESAEMLPEALEIISRIKAPVYAIPGNHDYWCNADFSLLRETLAENGGAFLESEAVLHHDGKIQILGDSLIPWNYSNARAPGAKQIFLTHYPDKSLRLQGAPFDAILAGHSHGGQVRLPIFGPLIRMKGAEDFQRGLHKTAQGPLYVSQGIGTYFLEIRFFCRPEITVISI